MQRDGPTSQAALRIGAWDVLPELNELRRGDDAVRIEPKAMELLLVLAARAPQVVSRAELMQAVWPRVVVGDEALTQAVTKLRRALGDTARTPAYIETIAKRGYRLVAAVSVASAADDAPRADGADTTAPLSATLPSAVEAPPGRQADRSRRTWRTALAAAVVIAAAAAPWVLQRQVPAPVGGEPTTAVPAVDSVPAIAVADFERLGGDAEHDYLARGIATDLAHDLAGLGNVEVIEAESVSGASSAAATRAQLRVAGTLQVVGGTLRVNVRLVDASSSRVMWSQRYERDAGDLLAVQKDIVARLMQALPVQVDEAQRQRIARRHTANDRAYDLFLRGRALLASRERADTAQARALFLHAIELDPRFARAYASLAMTHAFDHRYGTLRDVRSLSRAHDFAETARQINPTLPEPYWVLGFVSAQQGRHREAQRHLQQALALNPSYGDAHALLGAVQTYVGDPAAALQSLRAALRFVPDGRAYMYELLGRAYFFLGDHEQALINLREAAARNAAVIDTQVFLAATLAAAGQADEARWVALQIRALDPGFTIATWTEGYPTTVAAHRERLLALLVPLGL